MPNMNPWLNLTIVIVLGLTVLLGMGGLIALDYEGRSPSSALVSLVGTCVGALASYLVAGPRNGNGTYPPTTTGVKP